MSDTERNQCRKTVVVLVPGMFSPKVTMWPMARRLKRQGFQTLIFQNRYLLQTPQQNAQRLFGDLQTLPADTVHLLGHSLGGIVIMHLLKINRERPVAERFANGKVVLIASPVKGSQFARRLYANGLGRKLMGRCVVGGVLNGMPEELDGRETGVISGSSRLGLAAMIYKSEHTNDGMINECETQLEGAQDSISVPKSHALMLFSSRCSELAAQFLQHGRFLENSSE